MLESGFLTAALAFVGIMPAHESLHPEQLPLPNLNLALVPNDPVVRPTMPTPLQDGSMPAATRSDSLQHVRNTLQRVRHPLPPACTGDFINWLRDIGELGELSQRRLLSLYAEFCDNTFEPVSTRTLQRQMSQQGVLKRRLSPTRVNGKYHSPTVYRVLPIEQERAAA